MIYREKIPFLINHLEAERQKRDDNVLNRVVDPNTWNLDPDPGVWPNLDPDPRLRKKF